jgi:hypothetical protein
VLFVGGGYKVATYETAAHFLRQEVDPRVGAQFSILHDASNGEHWEHRLGGGVGHTWSLALGDDPASNHRPWLSEPFKRTYLFVSYEALFGAPSRVRSAWEVAVLFLPIELSDDGVQYPGFIELGIRGGWNFGF